MKLKYCSLREIRNYELVPLEWIDPYQSILDINIAHKTIKENFAIQLIFILMIKLDIISPSKRNSIEFFF
jgi:hypothetical protein